MLLLSNVGWLIGIWKPSIACETMTDTCKLVIKTIPALWFQHLVDPSSFLQVGVAYMAIYSVLAGITKSSSELTVSSPSPPPPPLS